jgi:phenylpropionate dioxygenase-like ring-hydroxylating dioxygenase large terminal subunit
MDKVDSGRKPGEARCPAGTWDEIAALDSRPLPDFLCKESYRYLGSAPLAASRYTDPEFFALEKARMWPRVWQFAAREEDMPEPNDFVVYDNVGRSFLIVRQPDGSIRAFRNVCRHRGRQLRSHRGVRRQGDSCQLEGHRRGLHGNISRTADPSAAERLYR